MKIYKIGRRKKGSLLCFWSSWSTWAYIKLNKKNGSLTASFSPQSSLEPAAYGSRFTTLFWPVRRSGKIGGEFAKMYTQDYYLPAYRLQHNKLWTWQLYNITQRKTELCLLGTQCFSTSFCDYLYKIICLLLQKSSTIAILVRWALLNRDLITIACLPADMYISKTNKTVEHA